MRKEVIKEFEPRITDDDILVLALAQTSITKFPAYIQPWYKALAEICQRFQESIPELKTVFFDEKGESLPPNEVVNNLLAPLSMSHFIELSGLNIQMTPEDKEAIIALEAERLSQYEDQIAEMSLIFEKHLTPKKTSR